MDQKLRKSPLSATFLQSSVLDCIVHYMHNKKRKISTEAKRMFYTKMSSVEEEAFSSQFYDLHTANPHVFPFSHKDRLLNCSSVKAKEFGYLFDPCKGRSEMPSTNPVEVYLMFNASPLCLYVVCMSVCECVFSVLYYR